MRWREVCVPVAAAIVECEQDHARNSKWRRRWVAAYLEAYRARAFNAK